MAKPGTYGKGTECFVPFESKKVALRRDGFAPWAARSEKYGSEGDMLECRARFKHDEDEITYSKAFRRLSHKSQIVVRPESDHFRSRLTHTLEVNQIAESIAYRLGLNINLVNAIALGHDIGHCPFGHAGEREMQAVIRGLLLPTKAPLVDARELAVNLGNEFGVAIDGFVDENGNPKNDQWLFHHAINSVRIISRKMKDIQKATTDGILTHSWSPWQEKEKLKFGVPCTYEAQAVAIADQVAGMNHDTEDILDCPESQYGIDRVREELPGFFQEKGLAYAEGGTFLAWFLAPGAASGNGYARKTRLQRIINDIVTTSLPILEERDEASSDTAHTPLATSETLSKYLSAYESFVRDRVIKGVSWFRHRDAVAEAVIRTAFNFYWHYGWLKTNEAEVKPAQLKEEVGKYIRDFRDSVHEPTYERDPYFRAITKSAHQGGTQADKAIRTMDYIAGMTDPLIMNVQALTLRLFR